MLVVDDNETNREVISRQLEQRGARVQTAEDAATALTLFEQARGDGGQRFDAAVLDVLMPDMDGFELLEQLRTAGDETPVLVATSAPTPKDAERCKRLRVAAYLPKPLTAAELTEALARATRSETREHPVVRANLQAQPTRPLRLLLAEDNAVNRLVARKLLEKRGHRVETANDGQQAVDRFASAEEPYDAILMDVQMPELDGFRAQRRLAEARGTGRAARLERSG